MCCGARESGAGVPQSKSDWCYNKEGRPYLARTGRPCGSRLWYKPKGCGKPRGCVAFPAVPTEIRLRKEGTVTTQPVSSTTAADRKKVTVRTLQAKKRRGEPITMLTAYDYPTAVAVDRAGIDVILVGDSLGMVVLGYENTLPVTMEDMLHHCKAVARGARYAFLVGDMPFMSYQVSVEEALG